MRRYICAFALFTFMALPLHAQETPEALQAGITAAVKAGDAEALSMLYADNAVLYPVGEKVARGRAAIRAAWQPFLTDNTIHDVKIMEDGHRSDDETNVAWGFWSVTFTPKQEGAEKITLEGRFMDMSTKTGGQWLYLVDHASVPFEPPE